MFDIDELLDWFRAQLDDDERVARAAAEAAGAADWGVAPGGGVRAADGTGAHRIVVTGAVEVGRHVARHDPAQVLHEISVKRQMLDSRYCNERVLRFLLLAYAGRAGYRREWGPGDEWYFAQPARD